ncbi:MAG: hypothetical protein LBT09_09730 [Planctomycetaceae bacterium]|jgi:signal transduction histidine kinase|nr:hypothetical protein [Planctomycetaceae bacterium]
MKTTKTKKPPTKGISKKNLPSKNTLKKNTPKIPLNKKQIAIQNNQPNVDVAGVCDFGDDVFWSDFLSGKRSISELRAVFELELERQKLDALAEFAAGAGHEINNPLAIISGYAQLLIRETNNIEHRHKLALIIAQVKRAYEMIADIRYFARPPVPVVSRFDLVDELGKVVEEQKSKLQEIEPAMDIEINFKTSIKSLFVETDQVQLHIAVSAICNNARESLLSKNLAEGAGLARRTEQTDQMERVSCEVVGRIVVRLCEVVGGEVEISVEDNGVGISPEIRKLIFCPYFSGRQAGRGLGFGLPKTWRIIQLLGGTIKTETTQKNKNTKFIITIPKKLK